MKRITESVSQYYETESVIRFKKNCKFFYETDYRIRFTALWNGFCNPFHKKICNFFWKRNTDSVS